MPDASPVTLIVGQDSFVGGALLEHLRRRGDRVLGTTRRQGVTDSTSIYLDLAVNLDGWRCPEPVAVAVICAGVTRLEACRQDPAASHRVNVDGVCDLIRTLVTSGAFVVYLSTNHVFDGMIPYRLPDDPVSPMTEYGRQRAEVERRIRQWGDAVAIVRSTKIVGPATSPFPEWAHALRQRTIIYPFADMVMAPVPLSWAVSVLRLVAATRLPGILQVSGQADISYAEAARLGARAMGVEPELVQPVRAAGTGYQEPLPPHSTLNIDRLKATFGIQPPDVRWTVETVFVNSQVLAGPF